MGPITGRPKDTACGYGCHHPPQTADVAVDDATAAVSAAAAAAGPAWLHDKMACSRSFPPITHDHMSRPV